MGKPDSWYAGFANWGMTASGVKAHAIYVDGSLCTASKIVGEAEPGKIPPEDYCRRCLAQIRVMHEERKP